MKRLWRTATCLQMTQETGPMTLIHSNAAFYVEIGSHPPGLFMFSKSHEDISACAGETLDWLPVTSNCHLLPLGRPCDE